MGHTIVNKSTMKSNISPKQGQFFNMGIILGNFGKHFLVTLQTSLCPEDRPESTVRTSSYTVSADADAKCGLSLGHTK